MATPERAFWPLTPRPPVLPLPEPIPRPTRTRSLEAPSLSLISSSFMMISSASLVVDAANEMLDRTDHGANRRGILQGAKKEHLVVAATDQDLALDGREGDGAT